MASSILPLPTDVLSQITSSITIASLNDAVLNLIKNSLDSHAFSIDVTVDYGRGGCDVEDDGLGIQPVEFTVKGGLGKMHHTSKHSQQTETHGARGSFLASLSALALVSITSYHHNHRCPNTLSMHRSKVIAREIPTSAQRRIADKDHGTRVTVRDLFGSMPVRVRQRNSEPAANDKDWQSLRKIIIGLLLAWPYAVSIAVRNIVSNQKMRIRSNPDRNSVNHICSILSQAMFNTPTDKEFWVSATGSTRSLLISGTISTQPCPHKNVQFLSFQIYPIVDCNGGNVLYELINRIFSKSSFGNEEDETLNDIERHKTDARYKQDGYTNKQLKSSKKGPNKWPMFCLKIESRDESSSLGEVVADRFLDERGGHLTSVMDLLKEMVVGFLKQHHFRVDSRNGGVRSIKTREVRPARSQSMIDEKRDVATSKGKATKNLKKLSPSDLATGIKLASFSRGFSSNSEPPFYAWTRIKRGKVRNEQGQVNVPSSPSIDSILSEKGSSSIVKPKLQGTRTTRSSTQQINATEHDKSRKSLHTSLDGRVDGPPITPAGIDQHEQKITDVEDSTYEEDLDSPNENEVFDGDLVAWVNPILKEKSLISRRTGMVFAHQVSKAIPGLTSPLSTLESRQPIPRIGLGHCTGKSSRQESTTWISGLLNSWDNPVFEPANLPIPQVSMDGFDIHSQQIMHGHLHDCSRVDIDRAFRSSSGGLIGRLTKDALRNAGIISQVDKKFILIKISSTGKEGSSNNRKSDPNLLVLVDQHAADERCRVEDLLRELCKNDAREPLDPSLSFTVSDQELQLFQKDAKHFENWGISYEIHDRSANGVRNSHVTVKTLPSAIIERCRHEPTILTKLMKAEIWKFNQRHAVSTSQKLDAPEGNEWFTKLWDCPEGIIDLVNSRSCRSAIMFNDELDHEQCKLLVTKLARCSFPFQCAHGRPSMVPLVDLSGVLQNSI